MLVVIPEYVSSITSSEEFFVVDGDKNEEFEAGNWTNFVGNLEEGSVHVDDFSTCPKLCSNIRDMMD